MIIALLNHLWQSTLCAAVAGVLCVLLRSNNARIRYWLWFGASTKFLVPFALLVSLGGAFSWRTPVAHAAIRELPLVVNFQALAIPPGDSPASSGNLLVPWQELALVVWILGALVLIVWWSMRWWRMRALVRAARPLPIMAPVPVLSTPAVIEPGLFGIMRPVLLLPEGLAGHLSAEETRSIIAHELCHLRRRDNLTYAVHLLCQLLFWFYPLTWWLGRRLLIERERACDDAVVASGHEPLVYSESILKVCRHYIGAPVECNAGVSGGDAVYRRVQHIMNGPKPLPLALPKRLLVTTAAITVVLVPIALGLFGAPAVSALASSDTASLTPDAFQRRLYEQTRPQREVAFDAREFDKYVGYYEIGPPSAYLHVYRMGNRFFIQPTGSGPFEQFPESPTKFFATTIPAQWTYVIDARGQVTEVLLQQNGLVQPARKVPASVAIRAEAALQRRIKADMPSAGTEAAVRHWIKATENGQTDYEQMSPSLALTARLQHAGLQKIFRKLATFKTLTFNDVNPIGWDVYVATFANGAATISIAPLAADGKVYGLSIFAPTAQF